MKSNLAGLYIQIEAKKRRINIINLWKVPKRARWGGGGATARENLTIKIDDYLLENAVAEPLLH
jgi:hypothetical protein